MAALELAMIGSHKVVISGKGCNLSGTVRTSQVWMLKASNWHYTGHRMWQMLWRWAKRRHPNKPSKWIKARYFKDDGYWTFHEGNAQRCRDSAIPITRYVKVTGGASPRDPKQRGYWTQRKK
jgi:hypothetical protein